MQGPARAGPCKESYGAGVGTAVDTLSAYPGGKMTRAAVAGENTEPLKSATKSVNFCWVLPELGDGGGTV